MLLILNDRIEWGIFPEHRSLGENLKDLATKFDRELMIRSNIYRTSTDIDELKELLMKYPFWKEVEEVLKELKNHK